MKRILLKIFDVIRVDFWKMSYSKRVENDYESSKNIYNLVVVSEVPFYDPRDQQYKNKVKIPFNDESSLNTYIFTLDNLTNSDLIIQDDSCCTTSGGSGGTPPSVLFYERFNLTIISAGQTNFPLPFTMASVEPILYCNGQKLSNAEDFVFTNTNITLTNTYFEVDSTDLLELYYVPI